MRSIAVALLVLVTGCESGTEIAGVSHATVGRDAHGTVVMTATLDCMLAAGRPRLDGCDADDAQVCVDASWFRSEPKPEGPLAHPIVHAQRCQHVDHIRGATVQLSFAELPDDARTVLVSTSNQARARDPAQQRGAVAPR